MPNCSYSAALEHSAERVWAAIGRFDLCEWEGDTARIEIENGSLPNAPGAIRRLATARGGIRQKLLAHSEVERSFAYEYCGVLPIQRLRVTLHVGSVVILPIIHGNRASVGWRASFEGRAEDEARWIATLSASFAKSAASLRKHLARDSIGRRALDMRSDRAAPQRGGEPELFALFQEQPADRSAMAEARSHGLEDGGSGQAHKPGATPGYNVCPDIEQLWKTVRDAAKAR